MTKTGLIRTFHPIGQGAFYTERHFFNGKEFTMVYDCGSSTLKDEKMKKKITSTFNEKQIIDVLFISHFDADHVNGIQYLKERCTIKAVVLPLIDNNTKILLKINNFIKNEDEDTQLMNAMIQLIDDPEGFFGNKTIIIQIEEVDENDTNETQQNINEITVTESTIIKIKSGTRLVHSQYSEWFFIPFNYKQEERKKEFLKELEKRDLTLNNVDTIEKMSNNERKIKAAYENVSGNINENSLMLYSGKKKEDYVFEKQNCFLYRHLLQSGCLFCGDIDLKKTEIIDDIKKRLAKFLPYIGTIQVPHHGSIRSFDAAILDGLKIHSAIFSYGTTNSYGHPSDTVIGDVVSYEIYPHFVTEEKNSIVVQCNRRLRSDELQ